MAAPREAAPREAALIREKISELRSVVKIMWLSDLCLFLCALFIAALFIAALFIAALTRQSSSSLV